MVKRCIQTPIGPLTLITENGFLTGLRFEACEEHGSDPLLLAAEDQLAAYFRGERRSFDLPLNASGTEFQRLVWQKLLEVGYGRTCSYQELAAKAGRPRAARAVGQAMRRNPLPIFIPCHRVIRADGKIGAYGGAPDSPVKKYLLALEQKTGK